MNISSKIFKQTGYFLQEIARSKIVLQAILVGLISGILVVLFRVSIDITFRHITDFCGSLPTLLRYFAFPLITAAGGLVSGLLVFKIAPETKGSGIPYVKLVLTKIGSVIRLRSIFVKFFAQGSSCSDRQSLSERA